MGHRKKARTTIPTVMKSNSAPLVSIVTPIYNGEEFLEECIESVLGQTYPHWEYTIVDNCSTDRSLEIAERYATRDPRMRIVRNDKCIPAIPNHNLALRQISADSKYCKVVFGDDWIYPECVEKMVALAEANPSVGMVSAYCLEGDQVICTGLPYSRRVVKGRELGREALLNRLHVFGSANTVLYRSDLVREREAFFNVANIHADTEACFAILKASDFGFVHQVLSFTRLREGSLNTVSIDIHSYYSSMLRIAETYGDFFLQADELKAYKEQLLAEYYRVLGKSVFYRRGEKFWSYHKRQLRELGYGFNRLRLTKGMLANLGASGLSPVRSIQKLWSGIQRAKLTQIGQSH